MDVGDFIFFALIYDYIGDEIRDFGTDLMGRSVAWLNVLALTLVTIWILFQGYKVLTGQLREPLIGLVVNMAKIVLIVTAATSISFMAGDLHRAFTNDLDRGIHQLFTGDDSTSRTDIDRTLAYMQLAMATVDAVQVVQADEEGRAKKARALFMAGAGVASPAMAAGTMLLLLQLAMALVVGLAPIFIMCLIFDSTKDLFRRWLYYGLGTLFSMAMLSVVSNIALGLTIRVAVAMWGASMIPGADTEGISSHALQAGGLGLLLTMLIVSAPPMAALFFNGMMGNFYYSSVFSGAAVAKNAPSQMPGTYGQVPQSADGTANHKEAQPSAPYLSGTHISGKPTEPSNDVVRKSP